MSKRTKAEDRAARSAAALAERQRVERRRNVLTVIAVLAVLALIVVVGVLINQARDEGGDERATDNTEYELTIGPDDAPHTIVIYEDFLCPVCQLVESVTRDDLARLAEEGKVQVSYRPFNLFNDPALQPYSVASAAAFAVVLDESGEEVAKQFHDLLYEFQPPESGPFPDADWLVDLAVQAGAEEADVRAGIESGAGDDWVEAATEAAASRGINSTPTIYLDGKQYQDGRTLEELGANLVAAVS